VRLIEKTRKLLEKDQNFFELRMQTKTTFRRTIVVHMTILTISLRKNRINTKTAMNKLTKRPLMIDFLVTVILKLFRKVNAESNFMLPPNGKLVNVDKWVTTGMHVIQTNTHLLCPIIILITRY
jgi:hypothetical protein